MDNWDLDATELVGGGYIEFHWGGTGAFSFVCLTAERDWRPDRYGGETRRVQSGVGVGSRGAAWHV